MDCQYIIHLYLYNLYIQKSLDDFSFNNIISYIESLNDNIIRDNTKVQLSNNVLDISKSCNLYNTILPWESGVINPNEKKTFNVKFNYEIKPAYIEIKFSEHSFPIFIEVKLDECLIMNKIITIENNIFIQTNLDNKTIKCLTFTFTSEKDRSFYINVNDIIFYNLNKKQEGFDIIYNQYKNDLVKYSKIFLKLLFKINSFQLILSYFSNIIPNTNSLKFEDIKEDGEKFTSNLEIIKRNTFIDNEINLLLPKEDINVNFDYEYSSAYIYYIQWD